MEKMMIVRGKLALVSNGGSVCGIGIHSTRRMIDQIEASKLPLRQSAIDRLAVLKRGVEIWEAR